MLAQNYLQRLEAHTVQSLAFVKGLTPRQTLMHAQGKWNVWQQLEHICMTERMVFILVSRPSAETAETPELLGDEKLSQYMLANNQVKIEAPERLQPKGEISDYEQFEKTFTANRTNLKDGILSGRIVIDNRVYKHPVFGAMTISDWLNFMIHHSQRHLNQVKELTVPEP